MKEKKIPENLKACIEPQPIPKRWWAMGTTVEIIGSIVMLLMLLGSLVGIIFVGAFLTEQGMLNPITSWLFVLGALALCSITAFIFFCIYKLIALVYYTKSTVVYNSDVLANIAIKNCAEESKE